MRYRLRTLLILLAIGPPIVAWYIWPRVWEAYVAWQSRDAVPKPLPVVAPAGGGPLRILSIERMRRRIAELELMMTVLEKEMEQSTPESQEASSNIAALEQEIAQLRLQLSWMRSSSILRTTPNATFLRPKTSEPPGLLRFSPGIERAMLHEGSQQN